MLSQCCVSGEDLALKGDACANIKPPLDIVPEDLISSCFFSSEICCASKVRIEQCKHGVLAAKDGLDCHENGTDYYTGCCESCKIGLVIGDRGGDCRFVQCNKRIFRELKILFDAFDEFTSLSLCKVMKKYYFAA